jgi:hypothetical protein
MINTSSNLLTILSVNNLADVRREEITEYLSVFMKDNELVGISFLGNPANYQDIKECHNNKIEEPGIYYDSTLNRLYYFKTREAYLSVPVTPELIAYYKNQYTKINKPILIGFCLGM